MDVVGELATDPKTEDLSRFRTLSWARERRDGRVSSRIPASRALASGRGETIVLVSFCEATLGWK